MMPLRIPGAVLLRSRGSSPLPVFVINDDDIPVFVSHWEPTPAELDMLILGGSVELQSCGSQPPVNISVAPHISEMEEYL